MTEAAAPEQRIRTGIAILAWGSLEWDPRELVVDGQWHGDGPTLPLEFSRKSNDGRLTLVIDHTNGVPCRSGWWKSAFNVLDAALVNLANREGTGKVASIELEAGIWRGGDNDVRAVISEWLNRTPLRAVIWTDLKPKFPTAEVGAFNAANALRYLEGLTDGPRDRALEYLLKAPVAIDTPVRRLAIERGLIAKRS